MSNTDDIFLYLIKKDDSIILGYNEIYFREDLNKFLEEYGYKCVNIMNAHDVINFSNEVREIINAALRDISTSTR